MELSKQVVSLELAQKLKDLGIDKESLFWWFYTDAPLPDGTRWEIRYKDTLGDSDFELTNSMDYCQAWTVAELGEMLPKDLMFTTYKGLSGACVITVPDYNYAFQEDTEADARAAMLLYLLENKLI